MQKILLPILIIGAAITLGLAAAFGAGSLMRQPGVASSTGMMNGYGWSGGGTGPGMMGGGSRMGGWGNTSGTGQRLSLDQVTGIAEQYAADHFSNLQVAEVMEFSGNFYAVLQEKETGRDAMEILLEPSSGAISPEMGPNMMWNDKYGLMPGVIPTGDNPIPLEQARSLAQKALDANIPGATVHTDGRTAGMLSVNGSTGAAWFHTWHGQFIAEKEIIK